MLRRRTRSSAAAQRRHRQGIEYLETRQLLNVAPTSPEPPAAVWTARVAAFHEPATADLAQRPPVEVIFIADAAVHSAENSMAPKFFGEPPFNVPAFIGKSILDVGVFKPMPAGTSDDASPSAIRSVDPRGFDPGFERAVFFVEDGWQPAEFGMFAGPDGTGFDGRPRFAEVLRAPLGDARLAMSPLDGVRSSNGALAYFDSAADGERHATAGFAILFGQSAESEALYKGGRTVGSALSTGPWGHADDSGPIESAQRSAVGYLVAFNDTAWSASIGAAASVQAAQQGAEQAASLFQDVLAPRFAFDAAALAVAIDDLAAQADELGVGLLELLSPVASGEAALVAGMVGAGLAYRHWRGARRAQQSEEQDMLSSRFIRGPASMRIGGGTS